ncbi:MAG: HAD hydrolase-like protein [Bryobacterales bacterium]|nr:HAD hydrolase-like protein [Bryobacteraceae bacterium]MDW8353935.1 HAD hydrolase-like protein [Bryobacterales bacterium]
MAPKAAGHQLLVLFDIDGTLLRRAGPQHREALVEAVRRRTGLETTTDGIPVHGMLDPDILRLMMRQAGASHSLIRRSLPGIVASAQAIYVRRCPDLRRKVCPGVRRLLARLAHMGVPMGLVTGNLTRIGWKKMERAGLRQYFRFGAFGETGRTRAELVRHAVRLARSRGWIRPGARVWLIGDSPADVRAARTAGVHVVACLTGVCSREELAAQSPDLLVDDLRDLRPEQLLSRSG